MTIKPSDAPLPRDPPWALALAIAFVWAATAYPAFFIALFAIYIANLSDRDNELRINLVLAVPATMALAAVGAVASGFLRRRLVLIVSSVLPFVALPAAIVGLVTKFLGA